MVVFPNCKINIGLNIAGRRQDGFHDIETIFFPVPICDAVEIIACKDVLNDVIFTSSGLEISGDTRDNLCVKAYRILKNDFPDLPPVKLHLHKNIPIGAGLGGGSADAAMLLRLLNQKFFMGINKERLMQYALQLGSDCPFFILNTACFATGRGELLQPVALNLSGYKIMIVHPGIHINTKEAFAHLDTSIFNAKTELAAKIKLDINYWKDNITNDFEVPVFKRYPEIKSIKETLYKHGALYSAMTGTGSSVYGIFKNDFAGNIIFPSHYFCRIV